jgi:hypothetical protein
MSTSSTSSTSFTSTLTTPIHFHVNRRSSVPAALEIITTSSSTSSSTSTSLARNRVKSLTSPPLPPPPISVFSSSSSSSDTISSPHEHYYTVFTHFSDSLDPPTLRRGRSSSEPHHSTASAVTNASSSSSTTSKHYTYHRREPTETKRTKAAKPRDASLLCFLNLQQAEEYLRKKPIDYLGKAIAIYRQVIKSQAQEKNPWADPFFKLVDLLQMSGAGNNDEIFSILDTFENCPFSTWEKVDALMKKAEIYKKNHEYGEMEPAIGCWQKAKEYLSKYQPSAADKIRKTVYLEYIRIAIKKLHNDKKKVDKYIAKNE